jgi:hypothetical protein
LRGKFSVVASEAKQSSACGLLRFLIGRFNFWRTYGHQTAGIRQDKVPASEEASALEEASVLDAFPFLGAAVSVSRSGHCRKRTFSAITWTGYRTMPSESV